MNNQKSTYSWTVVIITLIIFWPIGVFLLIGKLANDRSANFGGGAGFIKFVGIILLFFALIGVMVLFDSDTTGAGIVIILLFGIPGMWLYRKAKAMKRQGELNRRYIEYIVNKDMHDLNEVARKMGLSKEKVVEDIKNMMDRGMLGRARLNLRTNRVEFPQRRQEMQAQRPPQNATSYRQTPPTRDTREQGRPRMNPGSGRPVERPLEHQYQSFQPKTIRCTSCSANNYVESLPAVCEYCGTSLHEKK